MKILMTHSVSWGSGSGAVIDGIIPELEALGHEVKVFFPELRVQSESTERYYESPNRYRPLRFPRQHGGVYFQTYPLLSKDPGPRALGEIKTYKQLSTKEFKAFRDMLMQELRATLESFKPDIIEVHHIWLMGYLVSKLGRPYVCTTHNVDQIAFKADKRMRKYARICAQNAEWIFALSPENKADILKLYDVPESKVVVMEQGYDNHAFYPTSVHRSQLFASTNLEASLNLPVVIYSGKVSKIKGVDILLKANVYLQKTTPCLLLIFGTGDLASVLGRQPKKSEMTHVHVMGHQSPAILAKYFNVAKLAVIPSRKEGFGITALEAMGCSVPLVAARVGYLPRIVVGELVAPENPQALAAGISKILQMPETEYRKLKILAYEQSLRFTWKKNVEMRLFYYDKMVNHSQATTPAAATQRAGSTG
jgi:glycosyltransferase involved in cell wall biosynthesis